MDRDSITYKLRRKAQVAAYHVLPPQMLSEFYYRILLHEKPNIAAPKCLNEKLQWLKLYYFPNDSLVIKCTDKYQVRKYIEEKGYGKYLTDLIGVWDRVEDIEFEDLPQQFVLKCTHGCAYNILCKDKGGFRVAAARKKLSRWLKEDFAAYNVELHYGKIRSRRIICEEYLGDDIVDYKFFCFNGVPEFFYVSSDLIHDRQAKMGFFDMKGRKIPIIRNDYQDIGNIDIPKCLDEMVEIAKELSKDFPFVRVDFFLVESSFKFAELTFTPAAAMMPIDPKYYDYEWGKLLKLPEIRGGGTIDILLFVHAYAG